MKSEGALRRRSPAGLAFAWILWPLYSAVLWAIVAAIQFAPLHRRLSRLVRQRRCLAALTNVLIIVMIVIVPLALVAASLLQEATNLYDRIQSGELSMDRYFARVRDALPAWVLNVLDRFGLANLAGLQERLAAGLMRGSHVLADQAINIGQNTLDFVVSLFVMLYLLFAAMFIAVWEIFAVSRASRAAEGS